MAAITKPNHSLMAVCLESFILSFLLVPESQNCSNRLPPGEPTGTFTNLWLSNSETKLKSRIHNWTSGPKNCGGEIVYVKEQYKQHLEVFANQPQTVKPVTTNSLNLEEHVLHCLGRKY